MVELYQRQLKAAIKAYPDCFRWLEYLSLILLGFRSTVKERVGYTPLNWSMAHVFHDPTKYVHYLRTSMSHLSLAGSSQQNVASHVPRESILGRIFSLEMMKYLLNFSCHISDPRTSLSLLYITPVYLHTLAPLIS